MAEWVHTPVGLDAERWTTLRGCRKVLVMVHTIACGQRLMDAVALLAGDSRLQVVFTAPPSVFGAGVDRWLADLGGAVVPWEQAARTRFDLAVAASASDIECVHAPVVVLPHGAGFNKFIAPARTGGADAVRGAFGLDRQWLVRDGRVLPAALVLSHEQERRRLAALCPEAEPVAVVAGDPCVDRLRMAAASREKFRRSLGVGPGERLVVAASTWGGSSLLGARSDVVSRLVQEARDRRWRAAMLVHPNVWAGHGEWQVRSWMRDWTRSGLITVPVRSEWLGVLAAADAVVGDHGSTTLYATLLGRPLALVDDGAGDVDRASPMGELLRTAPRVPRSGPVLGLLDGAAAAAGPVRTGPVAARITSHPGRFAHRLRPVLYRLLSMEEPPWPPAARPVRPPVPDSFEDAA